MRKPKELPSLAGIVFTRLTVIEHRGYNKYNQREWLCRCECGNEVVTAGGNLHTGNTRSCGCLAAEYRRSLKGRQPDRSIGPGKAARNAIISGYRLRAIERGKPWTLTTEQAEELFQGECHYCGREPSQRSETKKLNGGYTYNGIDRMDNARGYEVGNVVSCCRRCNIAKNDMAYDEFRAWIERVHEHFIPRIGQLRHSL